MSQMMLLNIRHPRHINKMFTKSLSTIVMPHIVRLSVIDLCEDIDITLPECEHNMRSSSSV